MQKTTSAELFSCLSVCTRRRNLLRSNDDIMSDSEASPSKNRNKDTLHIDDYNYQESEPKCINSLCTLINSRLKVLENEIHSQHKVWESIQREVDEVKSLIEDCTSTCGSSSSSAQENESENVDSAVESHKTCNSLYWGKIKQAEENVEEKKSLMRILSNDVTKLKNSKKKCNRKHPKFRSNIDLILEVTNGLHVLKCEDCKFCSDHLDFREGLLSAVIELVHFTEKNYSNSLEENKALKTCLQKIYVKTKSCLLHSQIYLKSTQHRPPFDTENHTVCVDNIYTSFEEFCQHFQNLQDELLQLRQILLAAEENHLDELFQDSHSVNCICYNFMKKGDAQSSNGSENNEAKFSKTSQKSLGSYEKKLKSLPYCDEPDDDPDGLFDSDQIFKLNENETNKQLETLRSRIYEAVRTIRDVEVEENDDENLISMVASLAEECSALRQEVSYLRNVRQEKKRSWNKLQCFIMDTERKLKGNRNASEMKTVIRDLGQIISSSESSSLDETVLYMYSNQLEWLDKLPSVSENPSDEAEASQAAESEVKSESTDVSTQTLLWVSQEDMVTEYKLECDKEKCDIGIQVEGVFDFYSSESCKPYESSFSEINREIYVVPEVMEESDSCYSSFSLDNTTDVRLDTFSPQSSLQNPVGEPVELPEGSLPCLKSNSDLAEQSCHSLVPSSKISGTFKFDTNFGELVSKKSSKYFTLPLLNMSDISYNSTKPEFWNLFSDHCSQFNHPTDTNMYIYMFLNHNTDISHKFNNMLFHMMKGNMMSVQISDEDKNWSCIILKSEDSPLQLNSSKSSVKYLPYQSQSVSEENVNEGKDENSYLKCNDIEESEVICREVIFNSSGFPVLSSNSSDVKYMPNTFPNDTRIISETIQFTDPSFSEASDFKHVEEQLIGSIEISMSSNDTECHKNAEDEDSFVNGRPALPTREGTFIVESSQTLGLRKPTVFDDNMYYTSILTTLVSSGVNSSEKTYVLFEISNSFKHSAADDFQCDDQLVETNIEEKHNVQHFVLCETGFEDETKNPQAVSDICHIIFCKSNANLENKGLFDISSGNNTSFNPLVPQYLPLETFNYDSFDTLSLTHNCEIYKFNGRNDTKLNNDDENSIFIPKNYLRFKTTLSTKDNPNYEMLDNPMPMHYMTAAYAEPVTFKSVDVASVKGIEAPNKNNCDREEVPETKSMWSQTDGSYNLVLEENMEENISESCEVEMSDEASANELSLEVENCDEEDHAPDELKHVDLLEYSTAQPEHVVREISLIDEINALKENLSHQNAVLQRLKEELEDSNLKLEEKESRLQMLQIEHSRLNEIIIQHNIKEVEDKKCQTVSSESGQYEDLLKEVVSLRQENMQHNEKIMHQNKTIQHVKAQLCSSISHLKTLKDSATKQLKKQKHQILKSLKIKQQLQETKMAYEKKCEEIEKKNETICDQEFQLHEIQARLDSTLEELKETKNQKSKETKNYPAVFIKVDTESQTDFPEVERRDRKRVVPVTEQDVMLKKHSEELMELQTKLQHLESIFSNKREYSKHSHEDTVSKSSNELKVPSHLKEGNIWKLLMISEQSYLSLLSKLADSLQISDLKGSVTLMHTSWLNCDELADARRQDHKKILQSLDKLKRSIRYLQETHHQEQRRQNAESASSDEKKSGFMCHSDEMHFQYLCEVLQRAQENLLKEYSQKKTPHQRSIVTTGSLRINRHANSRERRIPLELKNGKILALLDDKVSHKDLLPNKHDFNKVDQKSGTATFKSKSSS